MLFYRLRSASARQPEVALDEADGHVLVALPGLGMDSRDATPDATDLRPGVSGLWPARTQIFNTEVDGARGGGGASLVRELQQTADLEKGRDSSAMQGGQQGVADQVVACGQDSQYAAFVDLRLDSHVAAEGGTGNDFMGVDHDDYTARRVSVNAACAVAMGSSCETSHASARRKAIVRVAL